MTYYVQGHEDRLTVTTLPIDALVQFWGDSHNTGETDGEGNYGRVRRVDISVEDTGYPGKMRITHTYTIYPVDYETGKALGAARPVQNDRIIRSI